MTKISTELLKLLRKQKGFNQEDVAYEIGVSRPQYSNIESGNSNPSIEVLIKLLKVLNVSFEELYGLVQSKRLIKLKQEKVAKLKSEIKNLQSQIENI